MKKVQIEEYSIYGKEEGWEAPSRVVTIKVPNAFDIQKDGLDRLKEYLNSEDIPIEDYGWEESNESEATISWPCVGDWDDPNQMCYTLTRFKEHDKLEGVLDEMEDDLSSTLNKYKSKKVSIEIKEL